MAIRYTAVFFFIHQTIKHWKLQGEKKDIFTLLTFLFLSISELSLTTTRVLSLLFTHNSCVDFGFSLTTEQIDYFTILLAFLRPCFGYYFQSLSFLVNLHRWETIFGGTAGGRWWALTYKHKPAKTGEVSTETIGRQLSSINRVST